MKRFILLLVAACMLALTTTTSEAAPRSRPGGGGSYRPAYGGYGPGYGGYQPGYGGYRYGGGYYRPGYGYGYGAGFGLGVGLGVGLGSSYGGWYGGYGYGAASYSARSPYYGTSAAPTPSAVAPGTYGQFADSAQWGLRIDEMTNGGAAEQAKLRPGDIIIGVGPTRTQTFPELQQALTANSGNVDVVFLNVETKKVEKVHVAVANGKIGVAVTPVDLP